MEQCQEYVIDNVILIRGLTCTIIWYHENRKPGESVWMNGGYVLIDNKPAITIISHP